MRALTSEEYERYSRHLILPEFGVEGQRKLLESKVLLIGAGGLGSPLGLYLAAAGVGTLGLVDFDLVDLTNLQRQVIHGSEAIGRPKVDSAAERIGSINPGVEVRKHPVRLTSDNALEIFRDYDLIIDGTDNFPTRYLTNDACVLLDKPTVYGSIFRFEGQVTLFHHRGGPCYRCLYPEPPPPGLVPSCAEGGVLGVLPGIIGMIQALEAIKVLTGIGENLSGRLLIFDALALSFRELKLRRDPACPVCGEQPTITKLIDYEEFCGLRRGQAPEPSVPEITPTEYKARLDRGEPMVLIDVREPHEVEICRIAGSHLIPLGEIESHLAELEPYRGRPIVIHCRSGARSAKAVGMLARKGFDNLWNLQGGILQWADELEPDMPRY
ncbi:MAG TPA: molybdopterin-synthase adenylyltransferase MoeB [Acidobacteriota bacterium]